MSSSRNTNTELSMSFTVSTFLDDLVPRSESVPDVSQGGIAAAPSWADRTRYTSSELIVSPGPTNFMESIVI